MSFLRILDRNDIVVECWRIIRRQAVYWKLSNTEHPDTEYQFTDDDVRAAFANHHGEPVGFELRSMEREAIDRAISVLKWHCYIEPFMQGYRIQRRGYIAIASLPTEPAMRVQVLEDIGDIAQSGCSAYHLGVIHGLCLRSQMQS